MITQLKTNIRPAIDQDHRQLANLVHFESHVHRHLDWKSPLDWFGAEPFLVAEENGTIKAALVCPADPEDVFWIRLFVVAASWSVKEGWESLWPEAKAYFNDKPQARIVAIPLQPWFQSLLEKTGFQHVHDVVSLIWQRDKLPVPVEPTVKMRSMNADDLKAVADLDEIAFGRLWRNSLESLQIAFQQAALATVAEDNNRLIGYQISTASPMGGHLARLAVHPDSQGRGIGFALASDVLDQFRRRGALRVTVNTQRDNVTSLTLYQKCGFHLTGESYPVYQFISSASS